MSRYYIAPDTQYEYSEGNELYHLFDRKSQNEFGQDACLLPFASYEECVARQQTLEVMDGMKKGDEVFVCQRSKQENPLSWELARITAVAPGSIFIDFRPLLGKQISRKTMQADDGCCIYQVWPPTDADRMQQAEARLRVELISQLVKFNWGRLSTEALHQAIAHLEKS